jgi:hypothetical protein
LDYQPLAEPEKAASEAANISSAKARVLRWIMRASFTKGTTA